MLYGICTMNINDVGNVANSGFLRSTFEILGEVITANTAVATQ